MDSAFIHQAANELVKNAGTRNIKQIARSCSLDISETSRIKDMLGLLSLYFDKPLMYAVAKRENGHSFMRPIDHITILVDIDAAMIFQDLFGNHWHTRYLKRLHGGNTLFLVRREFNKLFQILECHHNVHLSAFWLRVV